MAEGDAPGRAAQPGRPDAGEARVVVEFVDRAGRAHAVPARLAGGGPAERTFLQPSSPEAGGVLPDVGQRVRLRFEQGPAAAVARVLERGSPDSPLVVTRPIRIVRQSRRRLYRIDVNLAVETSAGPARVVNLSGSGCLLVLTAGTPAPRAGTELQIRLPLPGTPAPLAVRGRIVRSFLPEAGGPRLGLDFSGLVPREQDLIVRYVFARQAELLRRGLLADDRGAGGPPR